MSVGVDLSIDRTSEVPVGTQLAWKLRTLIATGVLAPGARLPGIRDLAEVAGVNINTVRTVLARLEEQGLLVTQQGRGNFVSETAPAQAHLAQTADAVIAQAQAAGIDPRDLAAALYVTPRSEGEPAKAAVTDTPRERRELRKQIERLELELAEREPLSRLAEAPPEPQPRVLSAAELREVRDSLAARIDRLDRERLERRAENERARAAEEAEADRPRTRRWAGAGDWTGQGGAQVSWTTA